MVKHRRFSDKQKSPSVEQDQNIEPIDHESNKTPSSLDLKSKILSFSKYAYIVIIAALLSGVFTPLTMGVEYEIVIFGILSLFLGLGGGILIYLGTTSKKFSTLMIGGGLATITASLIIIYEISENSLFV